MAIEQQETGNGFAFLSGLFVGAVAGVLLAPQAGRETRKRLQEYAQLGKEELEEITEGTRGHLHEGAERVREGAHRVIERGQNVFHRGQQAVRETADAAKDAVRSGQDAIRAEKERLLGEHRHSA